MRAIFMTMLLLPGLLLVVRPAGGEESEAAEATPAAASKTVEEQEEFKVPPGFRLRKRGKYTLYCREESTMGTHFRSVKCYDETGIREMLRAQRDDQEKVDQMRRICGSVESCGGG